MSEPSLLAHRRRWPDFELRLQAALAFGRLRLEAGRADDLERPADLGDLPDGPEPGVAETIRLVRRHRTGRGGRRRPG